MGDQNENTYEWNANEGRRPNTIRLGNSEYYLIVTSGASATDYDGWAYTIRVWNNNGTIRKGVVSSYEFDPSEGWDPEVVKVNGSSSYYAVSYVDRFPTQRKRVVMVLEAWENNGTIRNRNISRMSLSYEGGYTSTSGNIFASMKYISNNIYAVAYNVSGNLYLETVYISPTNGLIGPSVNDTQMVGKGINPSMLALDSDTVALVYSKNTSVTRGDGLLTTYNISSTGAITDLYADNWTCEPGAAGNPYIMPILESSNNWVVGIAYSDRASDGRFNTTKVNKTGKFETKTWAGNIEFDTSDCLYPYVFKVSVNQSYSATISMLFGISYQWGSADGATKVLTVNPSGNPVAVVDTLEFDTADCISRPNTLFVSNFNFLTVYEGNGNDGMSCVYRIYTNDPPKILSPYPADNATGVTLQPSNVTVFVNVSDVGDIINATWWSNSSGSWKQFGKNLTIPSRGSISNKNVSWYKYDPQEGQRPDILRLGDIGNTYYLIASDGDNGTDNDGYFRTIKAWNNNGTVRKGLVDSFEYSKQDSVAPSLVCVGENMFAVLYYAASSTGVGGKKQRVATVGVTNSTGDIASSVTDTLDLTNNGINASSCQIMHLNRTVYACLYSASDSDLWLETINISADGTIADAVIDSQEINITDGVYPRMCRVDGNTIAMVYAGGGSDGILMTWNITDSGDIASSYGNYWKYEATQGLYPDIIRANGAGTIYVVVCSGSGGDGWMQTIRINNTGQMQRNLINSYEYDPADGNYNRVYYMGYNTFAVTYQWSSTDGAMRTLRITPEGDIGAFERDTLEFEWAGDLLSYAPLVSMGNDFYLIAWETVGADGQVATVQVGDQGGYVIKMANKNFSTQSTKYWWKVNCTDGVNFCEKVFRFTTAQNVTAGQKTWRNREIGWITSQNITRFTSIQGWLTAQNDTKFKTTTYGWLSAQNNTRGHKTAVEGWLTAQNNTRFKNSVQGWLTAQNTSTSLAAWTMKASGWLIAENTTRFKNSAQGWLTAQNTTTVGWVTRSTGWLTAQNTTTITWRVRTTGWLTSQNNTRFKASISGWLTAQNNTRFKTSTQGWLTAQNTTTITWSVRATGWLTSQNTTRFKTSTYGWISAQNISVAGWVIRTMGWLTSQNNTRFKASISGWLTAQNNTRFKTSTQGWLTAQNTTTITWRVRTTGWLTSQNNTMPELTLPSVYPTSGIASYTIFYFNITWEDIDGDAPTAGYLNVNISRTGWYVNASMTWVSGSNISGANYTYSTKLTAGSYSYQFWAYDGISYNHTSSYNNPTVNAQSYSISVTQSDSILWFNMTSLGTFGTQANVPASGQSSGNPALAILNQGNVPINLTIKINVSVGSGLSLKWKGDNSSTGATVITTSENIIQVDLAVGTEKDIWLWMDFTNAAPGSGTRAITITSSEG
jgi:hypothetical protein